MTLRDRVNVKKAAEQAKAGEVEPRKHILLRLQVDRCVRDAYFLGLVFAAFANDDEGLVDAKEREILCQTGEALGMRDDEVDAEITQVMDLSDEDKMTLIAECVEVFDSINVMDAFLKEFSLLWRTGGGSESELDDYLKDFEEWASSDVGRTLKFRRLKPRALDAPLTMSCAVPDDSFWAECDFRLEGWRKWF